MNVRCYPRRTHAQASVRTTRTEAGSAYSVQQKQEMTFKLKQAERDFARRGTRVALAAGERYGRKDKSRV